MLLAVGVPPGAEGTAVGAWAPTTSLGTARYSHTATLLSREPCGSDCGKVLVVGGVGPGFTELGSAELYNPADATWADAGSITPRDGHTATLLADGRVLVVGGLDAGGGPLASATVYDPAAGTWSDGDSLATARASHTATLLEGDCGGNCGKVLVVGGVGATASLSSAELWDPSTGGWSAAGDLTTPTDGHTATLLQDGRVLISGGGSSDGLNPRVTLASAQLFDPKTAAWSNAASLQVPRSLHTATLLGDGSVLAAGGSQLSSAERYHPDGGGGSWSTVSDLTTARDTHAASLLPDGGVLVAGGNTPAGPTPSSEIYRPDTGSWAPGGDMGSARSAYTATLLTGPGCADRCGKVLAAGGVAGVDAGGDPIVLDAAELFDPGAAPPPASAPSPPAVPVVQSVLPTSGPASGGTLVEITGIGLAAATTVLFGGVASPGFQAVSDTRVVAHAPPHPEGTVEVVVVTPAGTSAPDIGTSFTYLVPAGGMWSSTGSLHTARSRHTATLLGDGRVLVAGGVDADGRRLASAELYEPVAGGWIPTGSLSIARGDHTATLLPDGRVLVVGGTGAGGSEETLASAELYDPEAGRWSPTGPMGAARSGHTASMLADGRVLVAGGQDATICDPGFAIGSSEIFDPATTTWGPTGSLDQGRVFHTATLLGDGRVLTLGGYRGCHFDPPENLDLPPEPDAVEGPIARPEIYDPIVGGWTAGSESPFRRIHHTSIPLPDGSVLVAGGYAGNVETGGAATVPTPAAETFDPATGQWRLTLLLQAGRARATGTALPGGRILLAGGVTSEDSAPFSSAEVYDPFTRSWSYTGSMHVARRNHTATLLRAGPASACGDGCGRVLVAGGEPENCTCPTGSAELYTPLAEGYWMTASDGGVFAFGSAPFLGSTGGHRLNAQIVSMAATPSGLGYWLAGADGGVFAFGDAEFLGSTGGIDLNSPVVSISASPSGRGYWLVASDGGVFAFGDVGFFGSAGGLALNRPVVGMAAHPLGTGYWLTASDGGVFAFGDVGFFGSAGGTELGAPVVGIASTPTAQGYWLAASDAGVFTYGDAAFHGSGASLALRRPVVGIAQDR